MLQWITLRLSDAWASPRNRNSPCMGSFKIFRIIALVTQKGKGRVCPSQRLWWEESMTSSIVLPQGTGGQHLTGINSSPLISWPVCCLVVSQPFHRVVRTSCHGIKELLWNIHSFAFLFLFSSLCFNVHHHFFFFFTVQWGTLEWPVSRQLTLCLTVPSVGGPMLRL